MEKETPPFELDLHFDLKQKLDNIWENHPVEGTHLKPYYPKEVLKNEVTFLSLNPSFKKDQKNDDLPYIVNEDDSFYRKFNELGFKFTWTFLDLLYIRDSKQNNIKDIYNNKNGGKEFINAQIQFTLDLLREQIRPKLVIVANAFVEHLLLNSPGFNAKLDQNTVYRYEGFPFIIEQSKFIGGWRFLNAEKISAHKTILGNEVTRVLTFVK